MEIRYKPSAFSLQPIYLFFSGSSNMRFRL